MRLEQLHYLLVTANCHSMHKASEILHVSQQNISKSIRDLEKELSVLLFDRTASGLYLTAEGEKVYLLAQEACACTDKIRHLFQSDAELSQYQKLKGDFTAVCIPGYSLYIYNAFLQFHHTSPRVNFHLEERESLDVITYLMQNDSEWGLTTLDIDLAFLSAAPDFWQNYEVLLLRRDYLKVLTTVSSPLVQYQSVSDKQLRAYPLIAYRSSATQPPLVQLLLEREGLKLDWQLMSNSHTVFNEAILQKNAVALSSDFIIKSAIRTNGDSLLLLPMNRKIPLVHIIVKKKTLSAAGTLFHNYMLNTLSQFGLNPSPYFPEGEMHPAVDKIHRRPL